MARPAHHHNRYEGRAKKLSVNDVLNSYSRCIFKKYCTVWQGNKDDGGIVIDRAKEFFDLSEIMFLKVIFSQ